MGLVEEEWGALQLQLLQFKKEGCTSPFNRLNLTITY